MYHGNAVGPVVPTRPIGAQADHDAPARGPRVDLPRVLAGLRHLQASPEPVQVFAELAAVCVPALSDE